MDLVKSGTLRFFAWFQTERSRRVPNWSAACSLGKSGFEAGDYLGGVVTAGSLGGPWFGESFLG